MSALRLPERAMRQQIASAIDVVIQVSRLSDGTRKVISISEISGMEGDVISMQEIFMFERHGMSPEGDVIGRFKATGIRPKAAERLAAYGIKLGELLFMNETQQGAEQAPGRFVP
jgi:pilus assembly protein CpaF